MDSNAANLRWLHPSRTGALPLLTPVLHWTVGAGMLGMLALGFYMHETKSYGLYSWHKSIGVTLLIVIIARVVWRLRQGFPSPVGAHPLWQQRLARATHWILLAATLVMPLSGMLYSGLGGYGIKVFGVTLVPGQQDSNGKTLPFNDGLAELFEGVHHYTAWLIVVVVSLHIAGALKHHFIDKDATLRRMLGQAPSSTERVESQR